MESPSAIPDVLAEVLQVVVVETGERPVVVGGDVARRRRG